MQYRKLAGCRVSALGFGCMRLPVIGDDSAKIDEAEASRMIAYAVEHGVNYLDNAWPYHREQSEPFVGKFLEENNLRDKVYLATKLPQWYVETRNDCNKYINKQLEKLRTDHIDFYLVHSLGKQSWEKLLGLGIREFLDEIKKYGRAIHVGFSFHDDQENYFPIVDGYDWEFTQIMVNYMDEDVQAGTKGLEYAASKGLDVIAMEPLRGGKLTKKIPPLVRKMLDESEINRTPAELALRWVWNKPDVSTVLSGMTAMEHVVENVRIAETALPGAITCDELDLIEQIKKLYRERTEIDCTDCRYCLPCPHNVAIPQIFSAYNDYHIYNDEKMSRLSYQMFVEDENKADKCEECRECEEKCPQNLEIVENLKKAHKTLMGV